MDAQQQHCTTYKRGTYHPSKDYQWVHSKNLRFSCWCNSNLALLEFDFKKSGENKKIKKILSYIIKASKQEDVFAVNYEDMEFLHCSGPHQKLHMFHLNFKQLSFKDNKKKNHVWFVNNIVAMKNGEIRKKIYKR